MLKALRGGHVWASPSKEGDKDQGTDGWWTVHVAR
jgi:hypothetical protein